MHNIIKTHSKGASDLHFVVSDGVQDSPSVVLDLVEFAFRDVDL